MRFLIIMLACAGLVKGPPPWLSFDVSRPFKMKQPSQTTSPDPYPVTCQYPYSAILKESEAPCRPLIVSEHSLVDSAIVHFVVRGPEKHCEDGSMCSVKVGSRVQAEVFLSDAPPSLGLSLSLCSLSASSNPFNYSHIPLLVEDCPAAVGVSLVLVPPKPCTKALPSKSFSFQLQPFYNNSIQFLHCRVQLCLKDNLCRSRTDSGNLPECQIPSDPCNRYTAPPLFRRPEFQRIVTQPLLVTITGPSRPLLQSSTGDKKSFLPARKEYGAQGVGVVTVVGVTLCSFFIGAMLTAGLWCIHIKTSPDYQVAQSS